MPTDIERAESGQSAFDTSKQSVEDISLLQARALITQRTIIVYGVIGLYAVAVVATAACAIW